MVLSKELGLVVLLVVVAVVEVPLPVVANQVPGARHYKNGMVVFDH